MHLAIVDDLEPDLNSLKKMLVLYLDKHHIDYKISLFPSGELFFSAFVPGQFDAVFLDHQLNGLSGMDIARRLRSYDHDIPIIFITIDESYALEGYTVQAMDYILKPVDQNRLFSVMERLSKQNKVRHVIEIKENRKVRRIVVDDILSVRSTGHFLEIQTKDELIKPYMTLEYFLSLLSQMHEYGPSNQGLRFQNCCRGYLVCLDYVRNLETENFVLSNGSRIPISRSKYKEMQTAYANYLFKQTRNIL